MIEVWKVFHPDSTQFTYRGTQATNPKLRLYGIYLSKNWLHQTKSIKMCPYFVDHAGLSINILPLKEKQRPAVWRFRNTLLDEKSLIEYMTAIIQYY
jgi:hypothetical protein